MSTRRIRVAVVGCGWWSTEVHLPALVRLPEVELVAVVDPDPGRREAAARTFEVRSAYASIEELLSADRADAVVVATPAAHHYPVARAALAAGSHVLVEKPFTLRAAQAWELVRLAHAQDLELTVSYPYQHTAAARRARVLLGEQALGDLIQVNAVFASAAGALYRGDDSAELGSPMLRPIPETYANPSIAGGGQGQSQASHLIGAIMHATGDRVETVSGLTNHAGLPVDLAVCAVARFAGGAIASVASTGSLRSGDTAPQAVHYHGTGGYAYHDLVTATLTYRIGDSLERTVAPAPDEAVYPRWAPAQELVQLVRARAAGIRSVTDAPAEAAARAVEFTECLYVSSTGSRPVRPADLSTAIH